MCLECLDSAELIPVDASKQFELSVMDYLNWWAEQQYHDEKFQIPAGMIRQIVKHYSWHKQSSNHSNQFPYLENNKQVSGLRNDALTISSLSVNF